MQVEILLVGESGIAESLREEWADLLRRAPGHSYCQTYDYAATAIRLAVARGDQVRLLMARDFGRLCGLWPLVTIRDGVLRETWAASNGGNEEYSRPLVDAAMAREATGAILDAAMALPTDLLWLCNVTAADGIEEILELPGFRRLQAIRKSQPGYSMALSKYATWEDYLAQGAASHHRDLGYLMRRLHRTGTVEIGQCRSPDDVEAVLRWAFAVKRRWAAARHELAVWLENDAPLRFFTALAGTIDLAEIPLVSFIKLDGRPIAAQINLVGDKALEYYFTVYDDAYAKFSPGQLLLEHNLQWAHARGLDYDFRMGYTDLKGKFSDAVTDSTTYKFLLSKKARLISPIMTWSRRSVQRVRRARMRIAGLVRGAATRSASGARKTG